MPSTADHRNIPANSTAPPQQIHRDEKQDHKPERSIVQAEHDRAPCSHNLQEWPKPPSRTQYSASPGLSFFQHTDSHRLFPAKLLTHQHIKQRYDENRSEERRVGKA